MNAKRSSRGDSVTILDGVRGLAVLMVLSSHCDAFGMAGQGSLGVFLFFCLSGYVLTIPYAADQKKIINIGNLLGYLRNRVLRIVPLYMVLVLLINKGLGTGWSWYWWNISFIKGWGHLWSVAEEVRFYLLLPLVLCALSLFRSPYAKLLVVAGLIWVSYVFQNFHYIDMMDGRKVQLFFYMFLTGMFTCMASRLKIFDQWKKGAVTSSILSLVSMLCLLSLVFSSDAMVEAIWRPLIPSIPAGMQVNGWHYPGAWTCLFAVFFICISLQQSGITYKLLTWYPLRHMGLLSFSIYLSHVSIREHLVKAGFEGEILFLLVLVLSYALALFTYVLIEKPFLNLKKYRISNWFSNGLAMLGDTTGSRLNWPSPKAGSTSGIRYDDSSDSSRVRSK